MKNLNKYKFYLDNNNGLHIVKDDAETVMCIDYGYWMVEGFEENLKNIDEWYDDEDKEVYPVSDFKEIEFDEDGFITAVLKEEVTIQDIISKIEEYYEDKRIKRIKKERD